MSSHAKIKPGIPTRRLNPSGALSTSRGPSSNAGQPLQRSAGSADKPPAFTSATGLALPIFTVPPGEVTEDDPKLTLFGEDAYLRRKGGAVPTRLLRDFVVFDASASNAITGLDQFSRRKTTNHTQDLRAFGQVSPYRTELDPVPENEKVEDEEALMEQPLLLTKIVAVRVEYESGADMEIWLATRLAWYKLEDPSEIYSAAHATFFRRHHLVQCAIHRVLVQGEEKNISVKALLEDSPHRSHPLVQNHCKHTYYSENTVGSLAPELMAFANQYFRDSSKRDGFLQSPLINTLIGGDTQWDDEDNEDLAVPPQPKHAISTPTAHVLPISGGLAKKLFNTSFKIHGSLAQGASDEQRKKQRHEVQHFLQKQDSEDLPWVETTAQKDATNRTAQIEISGVGKFKVGDFALTAPFGEPKSGGLLPHELDPACKSPNSIANNYGFVQILRFHFAQGWWFHGRILQPTCQTIQQEVAHSCELAYLHACMDFRVGGLVRLLDVTVVQGKGETFQEPKDYRCDSLSFFLKHTVTPDGCFKALPNSASASPALSLPCICTESLVKDQKTKPQLAIQEHPSPHTSSHLLLWQNQTFYLRDFVYLNPSKEVPGLFQIGQIVDLQQWEVTVSLFGRYEDLVCQEEPNQYLPSDLLYATHKKQKFSTKDIVATCHVCHDLNLQDDDDRQQWALLDGYRVLHQLDPDILTSEPTTASLCPLHPEDFVSCSQETHLREQAEMLAIQQFLQARQYTCYDLYHGAGGLSFGFEKAGWKIVGGVDLDPDASATFNLRHPGAQIYNMDARKLIPDMLKDTTQKHPEPGSVDLLVAGPPCQDFSGLNRFKSSHDSKKALVAVALSVVEHLKPSYVVIENVPLLLGTALSPPQAQNVKIRHGVHKFILRGLSALGYNVNWRLLNSSHYGAPQTRDRVIYTAAKRGLSLPPDMVPTHAHLPLLSTKSRLPRLKVEPTPFTGAAHRPITVQDAIGDLPAYDWKLPPPEERICNESPESVRRWSIRRRQNIPEFTAEVASSEEELQRHGFPTAYASEPRNDFQRHLRQNHHGPPSLHITKYFSGINVERVHHIGLGENADHRELPPILQLPGLSSVFSVGARNANYFPGLYGRVQNHDLFQTIVTEIKPGNKQGRCLHPTQMRVLSVRECARAQCFPDDMVFVSEDGSPIPMHRQIGNAVPVALSEALARNLRRTILQATMKPEKDDDGSESSDSSI